MRDGRAAWAAMCLVLCAAAACSNADTVTESSPARPLTVPSLVQLMGDTASLRILDADAPSRWRWEQVQVARVYKKLTAAAAGDPARSAVPPPRTDPSGHVLTRPRPHANAAVGGAAGAMMSTAIASAPSPRPTTRSHTRDTRTTDSKAGPVTTTIENDATIGNGEISTTTTTTTAVGDKAASAAEQRSSTKVTAESCPPEGQDRGEWSSEKTVERTVKGATARMVIRGHGTYAAAGAGRMSMPEFGMTVTVVGPDGAASETGHAAGSVAPWETGGTNHLLKGISFESGEGEAAGESTAYLLYYVQQELERAAQDAAKRRESGGLCVDLSAQADKTTLASGEQSTITVTVSDAETGDAVPGAVVTASAVDGTVSEASVEAPGSLAFTADGGEAPQVFLSVSTPRGGDTASVRFNVPGWSFEGLAYKQVTAVERVPMTLTWSATVCGDPFTAPWRATTKLVSSVRNFDLAGQFHAIDIAQAPSDEGARFLIQRVESPAEGDSPFRLWIDDRDPAADPSHTRVEVTNLEPLTEPCTSD